MGERTRRLKDFLLRNRQSEQLPREYIAEAIQDLFEQMDDVQVVGLVHGNIGPMGGESSQIQAVVEGRWVTVNCYGTA